MERWKAEFTLVCGCMVLRVKTATAFSAS